MPTAVKAIRVRRAMASLSLGIKNYENELIRALSRLAVKPSMEITQFNPHKTGNKPHRLSGLNHLS